MCEKQTLRIYFTELHTNTHGHILTFSLEQTSSVNDEGLSSFIIVGCLSSLHGNYSDTIWIPAEGQLTSTWIRTHPPKQVASAMTELN